MNKINLFFLFTLLFLPAYADNEFTYLKKPINPRCIQELIDNKAESLRLEFCNKDSKKIIQRGPQKYSLETPQDGNFEYEIFGRKGNRFLIKNTFNANGPGMWSSILWVEKTNHHLKLIKIIAQGDRCLNGVNVIGPWKYSVNLTSEALLNLAPGYSQVKLRNAEEILKLNKNSKNLSGDMGDLRSDPNASCVAQAFYTINSSTIKKHFGFVILKNSEQGSLRADEIPFNLHRRLAVNIGKFNRCQPCFDKIYNSYIDKGKTTLTKMDLIHFRKQFEKICLTGKLKRCP